jgi:hypothetical protein
MRADKVRGNLQAKMAKLQAKGDAIRAKHGRKPAEGAAPKAGNGIDVSGMIADIKAKAGMGGDWTPNSGHYLDGFELPSLK